MKATPSTGTTFFVVWDEDIGCLLISHSGPASAPSEVRQREGGHRLQVAGAAPHLPVRGRWQAFHMAASDSELAAQSS